MKDKELLLTEKTRLKAYLKQFWVKPITDPVLLKIANSFLEKSVFTLNVYSADNALLKAFAQRVILSFSKPLFWENIEAYSLVENYIAGESTVMSYLSSDLLILDFGINTTPNKMLVPLVNGLISSREQKNLYTLVLSHKQNSEIVPPSLSISLSNKKKDLI